MPVITYKLLFLFFWFPPPNQRRAVVLVRGGAGLLQIWYVLLFAMFCVWRVFCACTLLFSPFFLFIVSSLSRYVHWMWHDLWPYVQEGLSSLTFSIVSRHPFLCARKKTFFGTPEIQLIKQTRWKSHEKEWFSLRCVFALNLVKNPVFGIQKLTLYSPFCTMSAMDALSHKISHLCRASPLKCSPISQDFLLPFFNPRSVSAEVFAPINFTFF